MANVEAQLKDVSVLGAVSNEARKILTKDACAFLAILHRTFNPTRKALLQRRMDRQAEIDKGNLLDFLPETQHIRENDAWKGAPPAPGLVDRRVEITGPTDRKMVVNALNSDVWTYMADFEGMFTHHDPESAERRLLNAGNRLERSHLGQHDQRPGQPV